jgi:hypothetical protein
MVPWYARPACTCPHVRPGNAPGWQFPCMTPPTICA